MFNKIVPDEVFNLVENQVKPFRNHYSAEFLLENYKYGVSDVMVYFNSGGMNIVGNQDLFHNKHIVNVRARMFGQLMQHAMQKYPSIMSSLELTIPFCFSDTSDLPLQPIPCLVFSKAAYSTNILIPSLDNIFQSNHLQQVDAYDTPLSQKENRMCFFGSFTGNVVDKIKDNTRLQIAAKAANSDSIVCRISRPPMFPEDSFQEAINRANEVCPELNNEIILNDERGIGIPEQLKYKYQLCVDGHVSAWSRLPWQMYSNCIPFKVRNRKKSWIEWFYPLMDFSKHCIEVDMDDIEEAYKYIESNTQLQEDISRSGKEFITKYWNQNLAIDVFVQTLILLNQIQNRT